MALGANQRSEKQSSIDLAAALQMIPIGDFGITCMSHEETGIKGRRMNLEECLQQSFRKINGHSGVSPRLSSNYYYYMIRYYHNEWKIRSQIYI